MQAMMMKDENEGNDAMDNENDTKSIQQILEEVTTGEKWKDKRASKLDLDDFLELLSEFNERGIHFA